MSIAKMKLEAIDQISVIENKNDVKEILVWLAKISLEQTKRFGAEVFSEKTEENYNSIIKKLCGQ